MNNLCLVVLCGGSGSRLWPLSRSGFPKQFLSLTERDSLFQQAVQRLGALKSSLVNLMPPIIVSGDEHRFLVLEQLREIKVDQATVLLEPVPRNTAPALALAVMAAMDSGEDPILVVIPADHHIPDSAAFAQTIRLAIEQAINGNIVTLGIQPDHPETGYGYIQVSSIPPQHLTGAAWDVVSFVEKPNLEKAEAYLAQGDFLWNSGMFVLKASVWADALNTFRPDIYQSIQTSWSGRSVDVMTAGRFVRPDADAFKLVPSESIDYAVMESCPSSRFGMKVVEFQGRWSDLGAWDAVWANLPLDSQGNAAKGDVICVNSRNNLVYSTDRLISLVGVSGLVVVETPDALLVSTRENAQEVKSVVLQLQANGRQEAHAHRKVHRPWGWYDSIEEGDRFKVKRIHVKPGSSLSLQKHHHRAEHWIVVRGTAEITNGDQVLLLTENQSTYIPLGVVHRLANPGNIPLEIIEVQSGPYLGEDDIVRLEDQYGRGASDNR